MVKALSSSKRFGQADDTGFDSGIVHLTGGAADAPHGGHIHDAACLLADHVGQGCPAAVKDAREVHAHHGVPVLIGDVGKELLLGNTGVVDEDIQGAELLDGLL